MAETLFTQLPVAVALTGTEVLPVDQPNAAPPGTYTTKRTTTGAISDLAVAAINLPDALINGTILFTQTEDGPARPAIQKLREWRSLADFNPSGSPDDDIRAMYDLLNSGYLDCRLLPPEDGPFEFNMDGESISNFRQGHVITGGGAVLKKTTIAQGQPLFLLWNGIHNVTFRGLTCAGTTTSREYYIYSVGVDDAPVGDILIENCIFNRVGESGAQGGGNNNVFLAKNTRRVTVRGCTFRYGQIGIATGGDPLGLGGPYPPDITPIELSQADGPVQDIWILDNDFESQDTEAIDINWDTQRFWIVNNRGLNIGRRGDADNEMIDIGGSIDGTGSICSDGYVAGNNFVAADASGNTNPAYRNCSNGIQVKLWSERVIVESNVFRSTKAQAASTSGARLSWARIGCDIRGNQFYDFARAGYFSSPSEDCGMYGNLFDQVSLGIDFFDQPSNSFKNINLTNNVINGAPGAAGSGINIRDFENVDISGCTISGFQSLSAGVGRGVIAGNDGSGTGLVADQVIVRNCTMGIVAASSSNKITRCSVQDVTQTGFQLSGPDSILSGNSVMRASLTTGFFAYNITGGSDRSTISNNVADDDQGVPTMRGFSFASGGIDGLDVYGNRVNRFTGSRMTNAQFLTNSRFGWNDFGQTQGKTTLTNASGTVTPWTTALTLVCAGTLTADRTVTLSSTNATVGYVQRVVRTASGAFNVDVGGLKTLSAAGQWCDVEITSITAGTATWELIAAGTL